MPKITHMKATTETMEANVYGDELIAIEDYKRFVRTLEHNVYTDKLIWYPQFPYHESHPSTTLSDEALYSSNHRVVSEDLQENTESAEIGAFSVAFSPTDTIAIARACMWELELDGYPVADEDDLSELEQELIEEAYDSYGKDDFLKELSEYDELEFVFDENGEIKDEYAEIFERYLYRIASYSVSYCGEMYPSEDAIKDALREICYSPDNPWNMSLNEYLVQLAIAIKTDKAMADRTLHEQTQPPMFDA